MEMKKLLEISHEANVVVVRFTTSCICDTEEIANASACLRQDIEADQPDGLVFDFTGVKFFSSQVLGLLLEGRARLQPRPERVAVCGLNAQLERVFRITNLDQIFTLYPDCTAAITAATT
ncbi:MAG: STAS domain-containing protein [Sedimentisphaerales bacterium]|nr:STAS domain-containing protein [Sedimentisphaerales bacterium]